MEGRVRSSRLHYMVIATGCWMNLNIVVRATNERRMKTFFYHFPLTA
jgi:hypothetical protein